MSSVSLPANGPARWAGVEAFLSMRAVPGLESATERGFRRNVPGGWLLLRADEDRDDALVVEHQLGDGTDPDEVVAMARRVADLDTDLVPIAGHLATDPVLAERLAVGDLGRLPGAFDRFEVAVRAIVGQQVSVAGARTLLGRLVAEAVRHVEGDETGDPDGDPRPDARGEMAAHSLTHEAHARQRRTQGLVDRFPAPETIAECPLELGMPQRRRDTIRALAAAVADGSVTLDPAAGTDTVTEQLLAISGIGPWTAGYVAMRCLDDPDGWPVGDLGLRRSLGIDAAELERRAERWRPWRAYAALLLWQTDPNTPPIRPSSTIRTPEEHP